MQRWIVCTAGLLALIATTAVAEGPGPASPPRTSCSGCHGIPPGTGGPEDGRFKPGSHAEHRQFACDRCHPVGLADITAGHINGTISLKPEIEYQYGVEVPWPSIGSGTCGGRGYAYPLAGCHEQMPDAKCFWVPGKKCTPPDHR